jgi:hypothetical protein
VLEGGRVSSRRVLEGGRVPSRPVRVGLEALAVLAAPGLLYWLLSLRGMAPSGLPDPGIHTAFIVDPRDIFLRYQAVLEPTARLREAARVGFLVPARLSYLLFGGVPGFFVLRYLLALVAIVPVYLLLRRLYGRWAGWAGIAVVMSSPVIVTAWGTDYPDSATISYLIGGVATLALSWESRRPARWVILSGALLTLAVWSLGVAVPLVGALAVAYLGVRLARRRARLGVEVSLALLSGLLTTALLAVCSKLLIGQFDFVTPTVRSAQVLSEPAYVRLYHSTSWAWAPYDPYLLVPPAIILAFAVVFGRRWREVRPTYLFLWLAGTLQLAALAYLQFFGSEEFLEASHFSSTLWASITVMLALLMAQLLAPVVRRSGPGATAAGKSMLIVPAALVVGIVLIYEAISPHVPSMTWSSAAVFVVDPLLAAATFGRLAISGSAANPSAATGRLRAVWLACATVVVMGCVLVLTVAPGSPHGPLPGTVITTAPDPAPPYAQALGGSASTYIDEYSVTTRVAAFVGPPAYGGEQLLTWWPTQDIEALLGPVGILHGGFNELSPFFPDLGAYGVQRINARHAAEVLIMSTSGHDFTQAVRSLSQFTPVVVRRGVLSAGSFHLHLWLVDLERYVRPGSR